MKLWKGSKKECEEWKNHGTVLIIYRTISTSYVLLTGVYLKVMKWNKWNRSCEQEQSEVYYIISELYLFLLFLPVWILDSSSGNI